MLGSQRYTHNFIGDNGMIQVSSMSFASSLRSDPNKRSPFHSTPIQPPSKQFTTSTKFHNLSHIYDLESPWTTVSSHKTTILHLNMPNLPCFNPNPNFPKTSPKFPDRWSPNQLKFPCWTPHFPWWNPQGKSPVPPAPFAPWFPPPPKPELREIHGLEPPGRKPEIAMVHIP